MGTMMKYKRLNMEFVKKNYPVLYDTVNDIIDNNIADDYEATRKGRELLYGLCLEIALKSDGTVDMFEDDLPSDLLGDEDEDEFI